MIFSAFSEPASESLTHTPLTELYIIMWSDLKWINIDLFINYCYVKEVTDALFDNVFSVLSHVPITTR